MPSLRIPRWNRFALADTSGDGPMGIENLDVERTGRDRRIRSAAWAGFDPQRSVIACGFSADGSTVRYGYGIADYARRSVPDSQTLCADGSQRHMVTGSRLTTGGSSGIVRGHVEATDHPHA